MVGLSKVKDDSINKVGVTLYEGFKHRGLSM